MHNQTLRLIEEMPARAAEIHHAVGGCNASLAFPECEMDHCLTEVDGGEELYDLLEDPGEQRNLLRRGVPKDAEPALKRLREFAETTMDFDAAERERLALEFLEHYLTGGDRLAGLVSRAEELAAQINDACELAEAEIEYLIEAIGDSGCVFIRNGSRHSAVDAEDHIRMKYKRARRYASTAELFIERLASKSSMSKKPYLMECPGAEPVPSGDWLRARLDEYRED